MSGMSASLALNMHVRSAVNRISHLRPICFLSIPHLAHAKPVTELENWLTLILLS
jgi:hypothetical protein